MTLFDFTVDKAAKTVYIKREFNAAAFAGMGCFYQSRID
jgi:hypothetical protein